MMDQVMDKVIRVVAGVLLIPALYAAIAITLTPEYPAEAQGQTTTTLPACTSVPVVIAHRDGCLRVAKGTPHLDPGTPLALIVEEDRR